MQESNQAIKSGLQTCIEIRVLRDPTAEQIDRCTALFLDALGGLPTLYLQAGPSPWSETHHPLFWQQSRERIGFACAAGQVLVCCPKNTESLTDEERKLLSATVRERICQSKGEGEAGAVLEGTVQGIWGVAIRAPPGQLAYENDGISPSPLAYNHLLTPETIEQRDKALSALNAQSARLLERARTTFRESTYLSLLVVEAQFRGLGAGKLLFDTVVKEAEDSGSDMAWYTQSDTNEAMYKRWGGVCGGREKLVIPGFEPKDTSNQTWRMFVKRPAPVKSEGANDTE